ncbi:MAG: LysM peptidoglycan-binding domain-containing protein, partial [Lachnospiraceae bacterium]|nr:LysM peptidoglycan-binding domain-containing protein [Lachnospiraceae bacterium]
MNYDSCNGRIYNIEEGDTLYRLSRRFRIPIRLILEANPYVDVYNLQPGEEICIPGRLETIPVNRDDTFVYVIRDGESIAKILDYFKITPEDFMRNNDLNSVLLKPGETLTIPNGETE